MTEEHYFWIVKRPNGRPIWKTVSDGEKKSIMLYLQMARCRRIDYGNEGFRCVPMLAREVNDAT